MCSRRVAHGVGVLMLSLLLVGDWTLLQSVAWISMLARYSQETTLIQAAQMTFSGHNPCSLCKVVQAGKKSQQKQSAATIEIKLDYLLSLHQWIPPASIANRCRLKRVAKPADIDTAPPTPPPRLA